jgi:hypothetical protein
MSMNDLNHGTGQSYRNFLLILRQGFMLICAWIERECGIKNGQSAEKFRRGGGSWGLEGEPLSEEDIARIAANLEGRMEKYIEGRSVR